MEPLVHVQPAGCFIFLQIMTFEQVSPASISYSRCLNEEHACNMHNNKLCVVGVRVRVRLHLLYSLLIFFYRLNLTIIEEITLRLMIKRGWGMRSALKVTLLTTGLSCGVILSLRLVLTTN